ncbi:MAG: HAMP domain-containing protein [Phycisphaerae bacterium]|nr:HAMP domain-containing protein [Phycisphaerae bacterium]
MRSRSFFTKLFLGNLLIIGVILVFSGFASYHYLNANYQRELEEQQRQTVRRMRRHFSRLWSPDANKIDAECKALFQNAPMRLTIIAADGRVLGGSHADPATMVNHKTPDRPEIIAALRGNSGSDIRTSETLAVAYRYFAEPIEQDGKIVGVVRIAVPVRTMVEGSNLILGSLIGSALIGILLAMVLALLLSWIWYRPLRRITQTARRIASGKLEGHVRISGSDELAQLGKALNEMSDSLANQIRQVEVEKTNLDTVVRNLREGVVALDGNGRIAAMNSAARTVLDVGDIDIQGKDLQEVIRIADVVTAMKKVMEYGDPVSQQIEKDIAGLPKTLDMLALKVPQPAEEGIHFLLVARDVTSLARIAKIKSEFAANASHELRTPLATIRAAVDSMESLRLEDQEEFQKIRSILHRHTTRLEELIRDLLNLHMIESAQQKVRREELKIQFLTTWVQEQFSYRAAEKEIGLEIKTENVSETVLSDVVLLRLILQNLLDNAIKFTPRGGRVTCAFHKQGDYILLRVTDTGSGIAPEFQERVFERFFQVEAARSGETQSRGTGLGLAIVKHAVERLAGTVKLQSKVNEGTIIEIRLPA